MIDPSSKFPLYIQLKQLILSKINQGIFEKGEKIPAEHVLAEKYQISRPTVRQALGELVQEGYLVRKRGLGTYVSLPVITGDGSVFRTFAEEMKLSGYSHSAKLILAEQQTADADTAKDLMIPEGNDVYKIVRLRLVDNKPLAIRTSLIPATIFPNLLEKDLEKNTLYNLFNEVGFTPSHSTQVFQAVSASKQEALLLEINHLEPLMKTEGIVYNDDNIPFEKVKVVYIGSQFRFQIEQSRIDSSTNY